MQVQIKKTVKAGNSSAVVLPKTWLNKEVRVELIKKTPEIILVDILEILKKDIKLEKIVGIYLVGSYARGEENEDSDIDILVITDNIDKEIISEGIYSILIVSHQLVNQKLGRNLLPVGQMIREAKPLINGGFIEDLEIEATKRNVKWYLDTTKEKLDIIQEYIDKAKSKNEKHTFDRIAYTLILRIRTLEIIKKIIKKKNYSGREFIKLIKKISKGKNAYEGYSIIKNNLKQKNRLTIEEAERLYNYLKKDLIKVKEMLKKSKKKK